MMPCQKRISKNILQRTHQRIVSTWDTWEPKNNFADRGERVEQTVTGLEEDTDYQLKVVVNEKKEHASFPNTQLVNFTTCKLTSEIYRIRL
jgi:hypothetical protein